MAETENLVLEHLRHIRGQLDRIESRLDDMTTRIGRIETDVAQFTLRWPNILFGSIRSKRVTRIEKRLDLVEG